LGAHIRNQGGLPRPDLQRGENLLLLRAWAAIGALTDGRRPHGYTFTHLASIANHWPATYKDPITTLSLTNVSLPWAIEWLKYNRSQSERRSNMPMKFMLVLLIPICRLGSYRTFALFRLFVSRSYFERLFFSRRHSWMAFFAIAYSSSAFERPFGCLVLFYLHLDESGSVKMNRLPFPAPWLSTQMRPLCASTRCLAIVSPMPLPPPLRARDLSTR
jgi:hypothetical protein